jgi:hypothetical protein
MQVSEHLHATANLPQGKETPVGLRPDLDMVMERKILIPSRNQTPILMATLHASEHITYNICHSILKGKVVPVLN